MTPYELAIERDAAQARADETYRILLTVAWHVAAFSRMERLMPLEELNRMLSRSTEKATPVQTAALVRSVVRSAIQFAIKEKAA